jgi:uncharacterized protein DUF732
MTAIPFCIGSTIGVLQYHRQDNASAAILTPTLVQRGIVGFMSANNSKTQRVLAALSVIAHADEHDDAFIHALERDGIVPTGDPAGVVAWAHWACDQLNQGANKYNVVAWLSQYNPNAATDTFLRKPALYWLVRESRVTGQGEAIRRKPDLIVGWF